MAKIDADTKIDYRLTENNMRRALKEGRYVDMGFKAIMQERYGVSWPSTIGANQTEDLRAMFVAGCVHVASMTLSNDPAATLEILDQVVGEFMSELDKEKMSGW